MSIPYVVAPPQPTECLFTHDDGRVPAASVIVPIHRAAPFLVRCLDSVHAQDLAEIELILINDVSPDDSVAIALAWLTENAGRFARALLLSHRERTGPATARNSGMRQARAPAALMLDSDNWLYPRCASRCLAALQVAGTAFVYPILERAGDAAGLISYQSYDPARLAVRNYIDTLAMIRRDAWEAIGGFPHLDEGMEDYVCWLTMLEHGMTGAQVPEILAAYRVHTRSRSADTAPVYKDALRRIHEHFAVTLARFRRAPPGRP